MVWLTALVMAFCGPLLPGSELAVKADSLSWFSPEADAEQLAPPDVVVGVGFDVVVVAAVVVVVALVVVVVAAWWVVDVEVEAVGVPGGLLHAANTSATTASAS